MNTMARCAGIVGVVVTAAVTLSPSVAAGSAAAPFVVVNAASQQDGPVPRGAQLSIVTAEPLTLEQPRVYDPWAVTGTAAGTYVEATCTADGSLARLPIRALDQVGGRTRIDVYYPNSAGQEPFGTCANSGLAEVSLHPYGGDPLTVEVETVPAHPGIFTVGDAPDGVHVDGYSGNLTPLPACATRLPADPAACAVRTRGDPAVLRLRLTGSDLLACEPCVSTPAVFELAPVVGGVPGAYVPQYLGSLLRESTGVERATVYLNTDTPPGEHLLRVRNLQRPEVSPALRVVFGRAS